MGQNVSLILTPCSFTALFFSLILSFIQIYSTAEIRSSLSKDSHLFDEINRDFRLLMRATEKNPNVLQCCSRKSEYSS